MLNVLFNNTLNTFYLWLYGIEHLLKDIQIETIPVSAIHAQSLSD